MSLPEHEAHSIENASSHRSTQAAYHAGEGLLSSMEAIDGRNLAREVVRGLLAGARRPELRGLLGRRASTQAPSRSDRQDDARRA